jgi:hypothetical protein
MRPFLAVAVLALLVAVLSEASAETPDPASRARAALALSAARPPQSVLAPPQSVIATVPQAPCPPQAPAVAQADAWSAYGFRLPTGREVWVVKPTQDYPTLLSTDPTYPTYAEAAAEAVRRSRPRHDTLAACQCSDACTCGCNEGYPCDCDRPKALQVSQASAPQSQTGHSVTFGGQRFPPMFAPQFAPSFGGFGGNCAGGR